MSVKSRLRLQRIWPLSLSFIALAWAIYLAPSFLDDLRFARDGVQAYGWYTDVEQQNERLHYAYQAAGTIYGGDEAWNEQPSDIYFSGKRNGDAVPLTYLRSKPWISRKDWGARARLSEDEQWLLLHMSVFTVGILLSVINFRRKGALQPST